MNSITGMNGDAPSRVSSVSPEKTNAKLLERTRENAAEMAVRSAVERMFGSYTIDGARGTIAREGAPVISYRVLAMAALEAADLFDGGAL